MNFKICADVVDNTASDAWFHKLQTRYSPIRSEGLGVWSSNTQYTCEISRLAAAQPLWRHAHHSDSAAVVARQQYLGAAVSV